MLKKMRTWSFNIGFTIITVVFFAVLVPVILEIFNILAFPPIKPTDTPTPPISTSTPIITPTFTQIPTPTSWLLGDKIAQDPQAYCHIILNDYQELNRKDAKRLQFNARQGYCLWIIPLNGYNATSKTNVTFWLRGEKGGEKFEVGLRDTKTLPGHEPKVSETASTEWIQVSIPLSSFKSQDLASLDSLSLIFKEGSGIIYISQLIFTP